MFSKQPQARERQVEDVNERKSSVGIEWLSRVVHVRDWGVGLKGRVAEASKKRGDK